MSGRSGPKWTDVFAHFDPDTSCWRTSQLSLELSSGESPTPWPRAGIASRGSAFPLPPWAPRISGRASSSSRLLKTPTAQLAVNGGSQHPDRRKAGGHGPTLADEVEHLLPTPLANMNGPSQRELDAGNPKNRLETAVHLLPTPRATDGEKGGPNQRGSSGDLMLPSAVHLLPTPTATAYGNNQSPSEGASVRPSLDSLAPTLLPTPTVTNASGNQYNNQGKRLLPGIAVDLTGPDTPPPFIDGNPSSDDPHPPLPFWEPAARES